MNLEDLRKRAIDYVCNNEWGDVAIKLNSKIIELDSSDASAYTRLGRCYKERLQNIKARELFSKSLRIEPKNKVTLRLLSETPEQDNIKYIICFTLEELKTKSDELESLDEWGNEAIEINTRIVGMDKNYLPSVARLYKCYREIGQNDSANKLINSYLWLSALSIYEELVRLYPCDKIINKQYENLNTIKNARIIKYDNINEYKNICYCCRSQITNILVRCDECGWYICRTCGACGCGYSYYGAI